MDLSFESFFTPPKLGEEFDISFNRLEQRKKLLIRSFVDPNIDTSDPWWRARGLVNERNKSRKANIAGGLIKALDEPASAWAPQATKAGGLPHTSLALWKPEPLGAEFKVMTSPLLDAGLALETQEGKEPVREKSPRSLGPAAARARRLVDVTKGLNEGGNAERRLVLGDSWFGACDCVIDLKHRLGQVRCGCIVSLR